MYLTQDHITHYLQASRDAGKMLIATDACGAGKTTAMLAWVAANPDWSVVIVVERKAQTVTYRAQLVTQGVPGNDIAVVTSDYPLERQHKYTEGPWYSKRVCLITHARLWMDPPQLWRSARFGHGNLLLIDEIVLETTRSVQVNIGFLAILSTYLGFDITKYRNCFDTNFDPTDLRDITPDDQETILRYLSVLYAKLVNAAQQGQDVTGDVLEGLSEPDTVDTSLDMPERVAYFACLVTYSILMGKTRKVPRSQVRIVSVVSPLLLWSHEFEAAVLFDGTGMLFPYPKDSCVLGPPTVPPRPLLHVKTLPISGDKRGHLHDVEEAPAPYYTALRAQLTRVVTALVARYAQVYVCTWRDKEADAYEHHTSYRYSATVEEEQIVRLHERPQFEIEPVLKVESLLWDIVHTLGLSQRVSVSHYGLSRGSNAFQEYDCVLLVGHFYYPGWKYHHYAAFSAVYSLIRQQVVPTYDANPLPLTLSSLIQEGMRVQARQGLPVDCYLCLDASDPDYHTLVEGLCALQERGYYIQSVAQSDLHGVMIASEQQVKLQYILQAFLTNKQVDRMITLVKTYPEFLDDRCLTIDTAALGTLWHCRPDKVCAMLDSIASRSHQLITYRMLEPGKQGRKSSAKLAIQLRPVT